MHAQLASSYETMPFPEGILLSLYSYNTTFLGHHFLGQENVSLVTLKYKIHPFPCTSILSEVPELDEGNLLDELVFVQVAVSTSVDGWSSSDSDDDSTIGFCSYIVNKSVQTYSL